MIVPGTVRIMKLQKAAKPMLGTDFVKKFRAENSLELPISTNLIVLCMVTLTMTSYLNVQNWINLAIILAFALFGPLCDLFAKNQQRPSILTLDDIGSIGANYGELNCDEIYGPEFHEVMGAEILSREKCFAILASS